MNKKMIEAAEEALTMLASLGYVKGGDVVDNLRDAVEEEKRGLVPVEVKVRPFEDASGRPTRLLAFAEIIIGGEWVIKGVRVLARTDGDEREPFVVFPAERGAGAAQDRWFDVAHPVKAEARAAAITAVLKMYEEVTEGHFVPGATAANGLPAFVKKDGTVIGKRK